MTGSLRDYQREAVDEVYSAWKDGMTRPAIVLPTGTGKTRTFSEILTDVASDGGRALALAHRGELLDQITATCRKVAPNIPVGRVQASRSETRRPITVASQQSLSPERVARLLPPGERYDVIVVDECHHAASPSYVRLLGQLGAFDGVPTLGVTATMVRGDRRGLGDVWEDVVFERDTMWAIGQGWLVEPRGRVVVAKHLDLSKAKVSRGDYQDGQLGEMVAQDVEHIVDAWCQHADNRITVAFCPTIESAAVMADEFRRRGIATGEVYGSTPRPERTRIYGDLAAGRIRVLCSVMVTSEGWDCPPVSCVLMARPTKLPGLYIQMVGRGLRPSLSTGKTDCLVLDVVGASRRQSLMTVTDLHKTARVNRRELDELPCEDCGGYSAAQLAEMGPVGEPCECPPAERDANGGRRQLIGPAEYEDVDMFTGSRCRWLWTRQGVRFLPAGDRTFYLWPDFPELAGTESGDERTTWSVASVVSAPWKAAQDEWLDDEEGHTLAQARVIAEDAALALDATVASRDVTWRRRRIAPTPGQVKMANRYGIADPERFTRGALSDEISMVFASLRLEQGGYR